MKIVIYEDTENCLSIWQKMWPARNLFDLWQVRSCFHNSFSRPLSFHVAEENKKPVGLLALCWDEEEKKYVQFPGETWHGKTWIEQNRVIAKTPEVLTRLLDSVPGPLHLRYLNGMPLMNFMGLLKEDEIGYLFFPGLYDFNFENYWMSFSTRSRKKLKAELKKLEDMGVSYRFNQKKDIEHLFKMNIDSFGNNSYFTDARFYKSFENLAFFLEKMGILRFTTVLIGGRIAAVDMGAVYKNSYTLLAGGTSHEFSGVAKLINMHHMNWSCTQRLDSVDFLCGNFNWKERFHLSPRPLYELNLEKAASLHRRSICEPEAACA